MPRAQLWIFPAPLWFEERKYHPVSGEPGQDTSSRPRGILEVHTRENRHGSKVNFIANSTTHIASAKRPDSYVALPDRLASSIQFFVEKCRLGLNRTALITKTE